MNQQIYKLLSPLNYYARTYQSSWRKFAERRSMTVVIYYHRVVATSEDNKNLFADEEGITADVFKSHLQFMLKHFEPVLPSEISRYQGIPGLRFAVTFDDGYEDNYSVAAPILKSMGIPGGFFVVNDFVGSDRLFWWEQLSNMFRESKASFINIGKIEPDWVSQSLCQPTLSLRSFNEKYRAQTQIAAAMRHTPPQNITTHLSNLAYALDVACPNTGRLFPMMNWDQVRELAEQGFDIGGHTASHMNLGFAGSGDLSTEVVEATQKLTEKLGREVKIFAYPYGTYRHYTNDVINAVKEAGCQLAFTTNTGIASEALNPYEIPRVKFHRKMAFACAYNIHQAFRKPLRRQTVTVA